MIVAIFIYIIAFTFILLWALCISSGTFLQEKFRKDAKNPNQFEEHDHFTKIDIAGTSTFNKLYADRVRNLASRIMCSPANDIDFKLYMFYKIKVYAF